jgi:hypothetical protein
VLNSGDSLPSYPVQPVRGTLEDAYLHIIGMAKKGEPHEA